MEIIQISPIFEVHRSRFRGGPSQVSLIGLWMLMDEGLPGSVKRFFAKGAATEPLRVSRSISVE